MIEPDIIYNFNLSGEFACSGAVCLLTGKRNRLVYRQATLRLLADSHDRIGTVKSLKPKDLDHPGDSSPPGAGLSPLMTIFDL